MPSWQPQNVPHPARLALALQPPAANTAATAPLTKHRTRRAAQIDMAIQYGEDADVKIRPEAEGGDMDYGDE
jgi:hypothetical protein